VSLPANEVDDLSLGLLKLLSLNQMALMVFYEQKTGESFDPNTVTNSLELNLYGAF